MSDVLVSITQNPVEVNVTETTVELNVTPSVVTVTAGSTGPQGPAGASGATELSELTDVSIVDVANNDVLTYDQVSGLWKANKTALRFTFTQATSSTEWIVAHNLGYMPSVTVIDSGGNDVEGSIVYTDTNNLTITFTAQVSGVAYLS